MLTNSTAALFVSEEGSGFVRAVNFLESLPYLPFIEFFLLGVPIAIHALLGVWYYTEARFNSFPSNGSKPSLSFSRNYFFTWQRITALILVVGVIAHVVSMRFVQRPTALDSTPETKYAVTVSADPGLLSLAPRLKLMLITPTTLPDILFTMERSEKALAIPAISELDRTYYQERLATQRASLAALHPTEDQWGVVTQDFGTALLLVVRDNFKNPWICFLYTLFTLAACFHAGNGLWTFAISWGISLNELGRQTIGIIGCLLAIALAVGGMTCIWMTYWVTLKQ
jgi:succinate dehydrogenase / fumarate reductase cytochrome b subunit